MQYEAVHAVGELGIIEATDTLIQLAREKSTRKPLRLLAIYSLVETGDERAYTVLDQLTRARERDVRDVARDALEEWYSIREMDDMADEMMEDELAAETEGGLPDIWSNASGIFSRN